MPKVSATVNLINDRFEVVTLHPGDEVPKWAVDRVTNPDVLMAEHETPALDFGPVIENPAAEVTAAPTVDYSQKTKNQLVELAKSRGLDSVGNKPELVARLVAADSAASESAAGDVDLWSLDVDELKVLAKERGIDYGDASSSAELVAVIQKAG